MKKSFLLVFILFLGYAMTAQKEHQNDPLHKSNNGITKEDYEKAMQFFELDEDQPSTDLQSALETAQMYLIQRGDNDGLIHLFEVSSQYAKRSDQTQEYIDLRSNKAQMLISGGNYQDGINILDSLIAEEEIQLNLLARFHKAAGDAYTGLENMEMAERRYFQGLEYAQEDKDTFNIGIAYISLASMHSYLGNIYDAIDYNLKGLDILENADQPYLVAGACNVLCSIFQELGNYEKAQEYAEKMNKLCLEHGYRQFGAFSNAALGRQYDHYEEYDKALKHFKLAIEEFDSKKVKIHSSNGKKAGFRVKTDMVQIYLKQNQLDNARSLLAKMEAEDTEDYPAGSKLNYFKAQVALGIEENNDKRIREFHGRAKLLPKDDSSNKLNKSYAALNRIVAEHYGDYKTANEHIKSYYAFNDSILKDQKSQLVHNLDAKYQKAEQEKEISKLSYENERAESQLKQKNVALILGSLGLAILSFLVFQFYKLYQSNKRNKEQLASQNIVISKALNDKNTLLKEIHHRVKNNLQVISSLLSLQSRYVKDEGTLDAIKAGKSRVQSMSLLHQNLYRDDNLKGVEMKQYFQNLGQNLFDTYNIDENIQLTTDIEDLTLDIDTVVPMGLITNELISNALKHAFKGRSSGSIHLSLKEKDDTLFLVVKDDGVGLPDGELPVTYKSLGATLIQSFAEKLEGEVKIDIADGSKVTVEIHDYNKVK